MRNARPLLVSLTLLLLLYLFAPAAADAQDPDSPVTCPTGHTTVPPTTPPPATTPPTTAPATTAPATTTPATTAPTTVPTTTAPSTTTSTTVEEAAGFEPIFERDWKTLIPGAEFLWRWQAHESMWDPTTGTVRLRHDPAFNSSTGTQLNQIAFSVEPAQTRTIEQDVYVEPGFEWGNPDQPPVNRIGKIGLGLLAAPHPSGGNPGVSGMSARFMWINDGELSVYAYHADRSQRFPYGDQFPTGYQIPQGVWVNMRLEVWLNSGNMGNGGFRVYVDDQLVGEETDIRWSDIDTAIDRMTLTSFHGGTDQSIYEPSRIGWIRYRNLTVS